MSNRNEKYLIFKQECLKLIDEHLEKYEIEDAETPWYHNTSNCTIDGKISMLKLLKKGIMEDYIVFDDSEVGCYLGGCITAIDSLKNDLIFERE